ncbi:MAG: AAA family ATPase [Deltaproteobacteria bacterium]|nr:AAA family ATPase [Deltaproteobacteria bacterium]
MYIEFYGLRSKPFELLPDPRFLYASPGHDLALTCLENGITDHKPFIVLSGDVGTGKTTLLNQLLKTIGDDTNLAMIINPNLDPGEFLEAALRRFRGDNPLREIASPFEELRSFLLEQHALGRRSILIVDEAQNIPIETLDQIRLLTNLQAGESRLLHILLCGQPQLKQRLESPELLKLSQNISMHYHLYPLEKEEADRYIRHRLHVAGYSRSVPLFSTEAVGEIHQYTKGVPRLINSVCDTALVYAFAEDAQTVGADIVKKIINDRRVQIGNGGSVFGGTRSASSYYERNERRPLETAEPKREAHAERLFRCSQESREPSDPLPDARRQTSPLQVNKENKETPDNSNPPQKKADVIAHHYRSLWALNQENRERLSTLSSRYGLLWKHYEQLRKEYARSISERRSLTERLRDKNERIRALQEALRVLLDQNRSLKRRLGHIASDERDDPD